MGLGFPCEGEKAAPNWTRSLVRFPTKEEIMLLIKQALPTGITNVLYASAMVFMYAIIGAISTTSVCGERVD